MQILNNYNNNYPVFKAHPEFEALKKGYNVTASSFFRHSQYYGSPDVEFLDVQRAITGVFQPQQKDPKKILIAGIGNSQEPFSFLAVINNLLGKKPLKNGVDMYFVDLQSQPKKSELFKQSFYDSHGAPPFAPESFVEDRKNNVAVNFVFRVKDEIYKYLCKAYSNSKKSKWETKIQDAIRTYPDESFDIISMNNILGYIAKQEERNEVFEHATRCLKKDGVLITDPYKNYLDTYSGLSGMKEWAEGIFKK